MRHSVFILNQTLFLAPEVVQKNLRKHEPYSFKHNMANKRSSKYYFLKSMWLLNQPRMVLNGEMCRGYSKKWHVLSDFQGGFHLMVQ